MKELMPMTVYKQFSQEMHEIAKLGKPNYDTVVEAIHNARVNKLVKQGCSLEQAEQNTQNWFYSESSEVYTFLHSTLTIAQWSYYGKQVYRFEKSLTDVLTADCKDLDIPTDAFDLLPVSTFYVQIDETHGFWFSVSSDSDGRFFSILRVEDDIITYIYSLRFQAGDTISSCLATTEIGVGSKNRDDVDIAVISASLQLVMYLATTNAEVTNIADRAVSGEKIAKTARKAKKEGGSPQPTVYYVGKAFGKRYEAAKTTQSTGASGTKKRPHIRRSHFHHFWTGSGDEKKLVLKWVSAIFVNDNASEDTIPTVKDVK